MLVIILTVIIMVIAFVGLCAGVDWSGDIGSGMAQTHLKKNWGVDEKEQYHE